MEWLRVIDDFLPNYWETRRFATGLDYGPQRYRGATYNDISSDWGRYPTELISEAMGFQIQPTLSMFRINKADEDISTSPYIHADNSIEGSKWASLIYLSTPEQDAREYGGTAFWRHKSLGISSLPMDMEVVKSQIDPQEFVNDLNKDGFDETKWELESMVRMKGNRLLIYPGNMFHSRWPKHGFGDSVENGRLIWVGFFREAR